jgi:hypothetical protein
MRKKSIVNDTTVSKHTLSNGFSELVFLDDKHLFGLNVASLWVAP